MKQTVLLQLDKDIHIEVTGEYFKAEEDVNLPEAFEIDEIQSVYKNIAPLLEYVNSKREGEILNILEEKILQKL